MSLYSSHIKSIKRAGRVMKTSIISNLRSIKTKILVILCGLILFAAQASVYAKTISLEIGGAQILKFEGGVSEVFIANPEVADVQISNPNAAYLFAKKAGTTRIFA